ncbi:hypothetical protein KAI87_01235, partial [Myxococcota bacterium]|nr:hypothetical protein [Myxococcota bacterium]
MSAILFGGCSAKEQGEFSIHFTWEGGTPDFDTDVYFFARVEERPEGLDFPGRILATNAGEKFVSGMTVDIGDIPNGKNRVVIAELREGDNTGAQVLYYGMSELFELEAGKTAIIPVFMNISPTPGAGADPVGEILSINDKELPALVADAEVSLELLTDTGTRVRLSNVVGFPEYATLIIDLNNSDSSEGTPAPVTIDWDLDFGHNQNCLVGESCPRRVYARFIDTQNYESPTVYGDATIDLKPPALASEVLLRTPVFTPAELETTIIFTSVDPNNPEADVTARITLYADESLGESIPTLRTEPVGLEFVTTFSEGENIVIFERAIHSNDTDGEYQLWVNWSDQVGNTIEIALGKSLTIDTTTPVLSIDQDAVTYLRSPWGNAASESLGDFEIPAGPYYALAPQDPLSHVAELPSTTFKIDKDGESIGETPAELRFWADPGLGSYLGSMQPTLNDSDDETDDTWARFQLANLDTPVVYATALDAAGNESEPVRIQNAEWVATPNPPGLVRVYIR